MRQVVADASWEHLAKAATTPTAHYDEVCTLFRRHDQRSGGIADLKQHREAGADARSGSVHVLSRAAGHRIAPGNARLMKADNAALGDLTATADALRAAGLFYPVFGILLSPVVAALAMSLSSVSVVTNALRLRRLHLETVAAQVAPGD
ncbi:MAG TPA: hypothetical protein VJ770_22400 [Stellaceae bacterium]|nr:hypothetical protein [Stellaceae bacterium]